MDVLGSIIGAGSKLLDRAWATDDSATARSAQAEMTEEGRRWQQFMRQTAYQDTVRDMKNAGLNPMLAYSQGATGTPTASNAPPPAMTRPPAQNLAQTMQTAAQLRNVNAQTENIQADTENKRAQQIGRDEHGNLDLPKTWEARLQYHLGEKAWYDAKRAIEEVYLTKEQADFVKQEIKNAITRNEIDKLHIPRLINEAKAQSSDYMKHIAPYTGELGKLVHSASEAKEAFSGRTTIRRMAR